MIKHLYSYVVTKSHTSLQNKQNKNLEESQ